MLNLQLLNPNRIQIVTFLPYNMQTIEHQLLTKTRLEYDYSGNQLNVVNDGVSGKSWRYLYNQNGQMFYDGRNELLFTYNIAGLPYQCGTPDSIFVVYSYLPSGVKLSATDPFGDGLYYIGPMVYRKSGGSMSFEGSSFPGGRIVGTDSGAVPYYYLTDHLGSTRAIIDGFSGEVVERDDYYPFGSRWNSGPEVPWNRYRFNGKEWQTFSGLPYIDYGARLYDPQWRLSWNAIDLMSEKYYSVSPYAFCSGNPVNFVDPDGKDGVYINFPEFIITVNDIKVANLGHSGVLLIDTKTGLTKYYEYGRYDKEKFGIVRNVTIPNVKIGEDGKPTEESLNNVLKIISEKAGHNGPIEGAYVESEEFESMNNYAIEQMSQNDNPDREKYSTLKNNCSTFAEDVLKQDKTVRKNAPHPLINRPNGVIRLWQKSFSSLSYGK